MSSWVGTGKQPLCPSAQGRDSLYSQLLLVKTSSSSDKRVGIIHLEVQLTDIWWDDWCGRNVNTVSEEKGEELISIKTA